MFHYEMYEAEYLLKKGKLYPFLKPLFLPRFFRGVGDCSCDPPNLSRDALSVSNKKRATISECSFQVGKTGLKTPYNILIISLLDSKLNFTQDMSHR